MVDEAAPTWCVSYKALNDLSLALNLTMVVALLSVFRSVRPYTHDLRQLYCLCAGRSHMFNQQCYPAH